MAAAFFCDDGVKMYGARLFQDIGILRLFSHFWNHFVVSSETRM